MGQKWSGTPCWECRRPACLLPKGQAKSRRDACAPSILSQHSRSIGRIQPGSVAGNPEKSRDVLVPEPVPEPVPDLSEG